MKPHSAFAILQSALEELEVGVGKAVADHAQSRDAVASVEYEVEQLRMLIAENALEPAGAGLATIEARFEAGDRMLKLAS